MPEMANIGGAIRPVTLSGMHSVTVTHQTTIQSIVPRASCGANAGRELLSGATLAILGGMGNRMLATNSKAPRTRPMFSFLAT